MTKTIHSIGEDALVASLARGYSRPNARLIKGMGDDASVTIQAAGRALLATTDVLIEGIHFIKAHTTPYLLGRKALGVSLSDIAAMGGRPLFHLVSIAMPPETPKAFVNGLYKGMDAAGQDYGSCLAGGNTARLPGRVMVSTTAFGEAAAGRVIYRNGARPGDVIYVTGLLGQSALGMEALKTSGAAAIRGRFKEAVKRHLDPAPRIAAGATLASGGLATAMMDLSDGLGIDLRRMCEASGVTAEVELEKIPVSAALRRYARDNRVSASVFAASGGEDYELLFTSPPGRAKAVATAAKRAKITITPIGRVTGKGGKGRPGVVFVNADGRAVRLKKAGFQHF
ncbi:MAG: thiamine-phosphate kinase [Deltaproteobacteria bacterium]|nr:thiamine-phosphate kinase [Deltaproteobacteria bacterium]